MLNQQATGTMPRWMVRTVKSKKTVLGGLGLALLTQQVGAAGFFEDSKADLTLKNFYINQDQRHGGGARAEEWGQGFFLRYQSGFTQGLVGFGLDAEMLYGLRLDSGGRAGKAGITRTPGTMFPLDHDGSAENGFGRLIPTVKMRISETIFQYGGLTPKLPVVNSNDGRLLPQTFLGGQVTSKEIKDLTMVAGKLERSYERNSSNSEPLSIGGGYNNSASLKDRYSNEFYYAGFDYKPMKDLTVRYYFGQLKDFYDQHFVGLVHKMSLPVGSLTTDLRYFNNDSDGENSSKSGRAKGWRSAGYWSAGDPDQYEVDSSLWSAMFTYALGGHSASLGFQKITGDSDFVYLLKGQGSSPFIITDMQSQKFTNAGQQTWVAKYGYDFASLGVPGLKASVAHAKGREIDAADGNNKEWETDYRVDYVIQSGYLKGLGLTARHAMFRSNDTTDRDETRLLVNYTIPLL